MKIWKIMIAAAVVVLAASELSAKNGIEVGYMNTMYSSKYLEQKDVQHMNGIYVGYNKDMKLFAGLSLQPGLYYSFAQKSDNTTMGLVNMDIKESEHNLNLPVDVKYTFNILPILKIHVFAGPTFSLGLANGVKYGVKIGEETGTIRTDWYTGKVKAEGLDESYARELVPTDVRFNRFDIMIGGGVGLDLFNFLTVKCGYDYGLLNRMNTSLDGYTVHRSQFYVSLGLNF